MKQKRPNKNKRCVWGCKDSFKGSLKCEILGTLDELVSFLGIIRWEVSNVASIVDIQKDLFIFSGELATGNTKVTIDMLNSLTNNCTKLKQILELPKSFVIPGEKSRGGAYIDYARTLVRRCERKLIKLPKKDLKNINLLKWINVLSYYLWLLARQEDLNVK